MTAAKSGPVLPSVVEARITHSRTTPVTRRFRYRSSTWLVDVDELPQLRRPLRLFARFHAADHFPEPCRSGQTLRQRLDEHLLAAGVEPPGGQVIMLASPRVAGYVFNPISVFWCHGVGGELELVVAEVHNTYGQRHCYVLRPDSRGDAAVDKAFYVSPFNDVAGRYRLHFPAPRADGRVTVSVTLHRADQAPFVASLVGTARPATTGRILATQLRSPLAPLAVSALIRWQGIRLWLQRLPIQPRPEDPAATTVAVPQSSTEQRREGIR